MSVEDPVRRTLSDLGIEHEIVPIDPAYADTVAFCERYGFPPERSANTILVVSKKEPRAYAACVVLATTKLDVNHRVCDLLGVKRASFATAEEMRAVTGMEVGGLTPFGLPPGIPLWADARVFELDWVILGGGGRDYKLKLSPTAVRTVGGVSVEGLAIPLPLTAPDAWRRD